MQINKIYLSLGSNIGDRKENINKALILLEDRMGRLILKSTNHITKAMYNENQNDFYNMTCSINTKYNPEECLRIIENIMSEMGRVRTFQNAPRIIDIDILFFNYFNYKFKNEKLEIPHPKIFEREFVTRPLIEMLIN